MSMTGTVADREEIRELYARYALTIDDSQFEDWVNCFTPDGVFDSPIYGRSAGYDALRKFAASYKGSWAGARVRHMMVNVSFKIEGDRATGQCNLIYYRIKDGKTELAAIGGYKDELRKENGDWRFSLRRVFIDK